jgi:hypothetical protein
MGWLKRIFCGHSKWIRTMPKGKAEFEMVYLGYKIYVCPNCGKRIHSKEAPISYWKGVE